MRKTILRILLSFMLVLSISFSAVSVPVYAATKTEKKEATAAKKVYKDLVKRYYSDQILNCQVKYKKSGKKYVYTLTLTTLQMDTTYIRSAAFLNGGNYNKMIKQLSKSSKSEYKRAKQKGVKKPVVKIIWKSSDGFTVATLQNGSLID